MIATVTPNPSLDRTLVVDEMSRGEVNRAAGVRLDPGGKGVNVARAVAAAEEPTVALMPLGGPAGSHLTELLAAEKVPVLEVAVRAATRSNVTVVEAGGVTTKINEPGPHLGADEVAALCKRTTELAAQARWVVACGSLPAGCPDDLYARFVPAVRAAGARIAVDTSGKPLVETCLAGPDLVKPNLDELAELARKPLPRLGDVVDVASELCQSGVSAVLVSLGSDGAVLVEDGEAWHATAPANAVRSTVGAGDALLAGFLLAGGSGADALRRAVAYGSAAVGLNGSRMPRPQDLYPAGVHVTNVDRTRSLTGAA